MKTVRGKYNSEILCVSSMAYLIAGILLVRTNPYLAGLLFVVTVFSILHHTSFHSFKFKVLDWIFSSALTVTVFSLYRVNSYIFIFIAILTVFRLLDVLALNTKRYKFFNYTHAVWHLLTAVVIVFLAVSTRV